MIIVTGGAGFIGSALVWKLNQQGVTDLVVADHFDNGPKWKNLVKRRVAKFLHKDELFDWLEGEGRRLSIDAIFHMGASSSTTEIDVDYLVRNNINYTMRLWTYCTEYGVPFIYASSASTYGDGERGFDDNVAGIPDLRPQHPYGFSKQKFDDWAIQQVRQPPFWAGLKFFNVYGPQEYHKGSQSSVVYQFVPQVKATHAIKLFKSYREGFADGEQARDFVYVKDCVDIMWHLYQKGSRGADSGIYNVGSGKARTFVDLARAVFQSMEIKPEKLDFIDMPEVLRGQYQYFTEAKLDRLRQSGGYTAPMTSLEDGVRDYVRGYLLSDDAYL